MTEPAKKKSNAGLCAILAAVGCFGLVAVLGIVAAVAVPAFLGYIARSKTAEARVNLGMLVEGLASYRAENGTYPPRSLPPTPAAGCGKRPWPFDADPGWSEIGFGPADPIYYAYEYETTDGGQTYAVRARGDLDCDGVESLYERSSQTPDLFVENELE